MAISVTIIGLGRICSVVGEGPSMQYVLPTVRVKNRGANLYSMSYASTSWKLRTSEWYLHVEKWPWENTEIFQKVMCSNYHHLYTIKRVSTVEY